LLSNYCFIKYYGKKEFQDFLTQFFTKNNAIIINQRYLKYTLYIQDVPNLNVGIDKLREKV